MFEFRRGIRYVEQNSFSKVTVIKLFSPSLMLSANKLERFSLTSFLALYIDNCKGKCSEVCL